MSRFFIIYIISLLIISCHDTKKNREHPIADTVADNKSLVDSSIDSLKTKDEDFNNFWREFRRAIINNDSMKIIQLTEFPFQTRATFDSDPVIKYNKSEFSKVFNAFLKQWNGKDLEGTTVLDDIIKIKTPKKSDINGNSIRIGDMVFKKKNKNWKLVFAYLNDDTVEYLKMK